jgi:hypothetical protein
VELTIGEVVTLFGVVNTGPVMGERYRVEVNVAREWVRSRRDAGHTRIGMLALESAHRRDAGEQRHFANRRPITPLLRYAGS